MKEPVEDPEEAEAWQKQRSLDPNSPLWIVPDGPAALQDALRFQTSYWPSLTCIRLPQDTRAVGTKYFPVISPYQNCQQGNKLLWLWVTPDRGVKPLIGEHRWPRSCSPTIWIVPAVTCFPSCPRGKWPKKRLSFSPWEFSVKPEYSKWSEITLGILFH